MTDVRKPYDIDSLTDVALRVFAERGYDGASMDDVARAAGITKASIYHHVAAKEEFLARGLRRALDALFAILEEQRASAGEPYARLEYILRRVAETTLELLPELSVLFRVRGNSPTEREAIERRRRFRQQGCRRQCRPLGKKCQSTSGNHPTERVAARQRIVHCTGPRLR